MWFGKGPKNAKRSRTVRRLEVNLGPVLRYSREKIRLLINDERRAVVGTIAALRGSAMSGRTLFLFAPGRHP